jgi:hypothetical protein
MQGGVYCAECHTESEPGALYCTTCGRPLRRFAGPRGVEWGPGAAPPPRRHVWPWALGIGGTVVVVLVVLGVIGVAVRNRNAVRSLTTVSNAHTVPLGQPVNAGDWKVTISKIQNPDTHVTDPQLGGFAPTPRAGNHFVGATVSVTNNTGAVKLAPIGLFFALRDPAGHTYTPTHFDGTFGFGGNVPNGGLDPGASVAGTVSFEVPNGAHALTLYFFPNWPLQNNAVSVPVR